MSSFAHRDRTLDAPPTASFWLLQTGGWLAYDAAMASSRIGRLPWAYMLASKTTLAVAGFLITALLLRPIYRRVLRGDPPIGRVIAIAIVCSYAAALLWTAIDNLLDVPLTQLVLHRASRWPVGAQLLGGALYNAFTLLAWSVLYVGIKHYHALQLERERTLRAEALAHEARLEALRYQLNPHFLFNALNAVSTLVVEGRNGEAGRMIARLGDLLRATLERPATETVSLSEELELVRRYLDVEQVRLGDRLRVEMDVAPDAWNARVPALLLQPLVENAVRHAVATREEGGRILIRATRSDDHLHITVSDDGGAAEENGSGNGSTRGIGIGLANARGRLAALYGDTAQVELRRTEQGDGTIACVRIPFDSATVES